MDLTLVVGNIALVCTIASSFSGVPLCREFFLKKSTSNVSALPFIAGLTCGSLWFQYSLLLKDGMLQTVNIISASLQATYIACYYINTDQKQKTWLMSFAALLFLSVVYVYGFHVANKVTATNTIGLLAAVGSVMVSAAPMGSISQVFHTKSSESLPFLIIFSTFVVMSLWFIYGILVGDIFIQIPNLIGSILSGFQLGLIAIYPSKKIKKED